MSNGSGSNAPGYTRCAACRYLRRRCSSECILAPYFPSSHPERFACVHRVFGASNVSKMIQQLPPHQRAAAADSLAYEAYWRIRDPIQGTVGVISHLRQEIRARENELTKTQEMIAVHAARAQAAAGGRLFPAAETSDGGAVRLHDDSVNAQSSGQNLEKAAASLLQP